VVGLYGPGPDAVDFQDHGATDLMTVRSTDGVAPVDEDVGAVDHVSGV